MKFYFDSSALTKRYLFEKGSDQLDRLFLEADAIVISSIGLLEIISAFSRLRREKKLNTILYQKCKQAVLEDFVGFEICQLTPEVLKTTIHILEHSQLRASDAIHVASAIHAKVNRFVSSAAKQILTAKEFNLTVDSV